MKKEEDKEKNLHYLEQIKSIRQKALKNRKIFDNKLDQPVSFWTKKERLISGKGKEFTIILRTKGCSWALGEYGGCSMCGYIQDANTEYIDENHIIRQFDFGYNTKIKEVCDDSDRYVLKIFNSGSFFDETEISKKTREYIYEKVANIDNINEFVVESRVEYINSEKLKELKRFLKDKYLEVAIGLETVNDYIRNCYINKGMSFHDFKNALKLCNKFNVGVKAYLLLKPPFLNEQGAIDDCVDSIRKLINLNVKTISINPVNVQKGTLVEFLWYQKRYRPPWFYSLFKVFKNSLTQGDLQQVRILSDPSGAGTKRGIHNCLKRDCEEAAKKNLHNFIMSQNLDELEQQEFECDCKRIYQLQKQFC
ncbi:MAG: archaeosine biosynthesis radical SAM protein RaSEA [Promethearchaeota archaeon]